MEASSKKSWRPLVVFVLLIAVGYLAYRWHQRHQYDNVRVGAVGIIDWPFNVANSEPYHPAFHPQGLAYRSRVGCRIYRGAKFIVVADGRDKALARYFLPKDLLSAEEKAYAWNCPDGMLFFGYKRYLSDGIENHDRWLSEHWEKGGDQDAIRDAYYRSLPSCDRRE